MLRSRKSSLVVNAACPQRAKNPVARTFSVRFPGVAAAAMLALFVPLQAHADVCSSLRAQLSSGSGARSPEVAQLNKQLAAISALQRQRKCTSSSSGGLFNACGDLANRKANVQRQIQNASRSTSFFGARKDSGIRARMVSLGCATKEPKRQDKSTWSSGLPGGNAMLFCVRLSDGYFFPTPNSQFVSRDDDYKNTLDRCQYICDDRNMDVYSLSDISLESEEMTSVQTHQSYKDLPSAFAYRDSPQFSACNAQRYTERVAEARARTVTPTDMSNAIIPLPKTRPEVPAVDTLPTAATAYADEAAVRPIDPTRKVRIVGPVFLPDQ